MRSLSGARILRATDIEDGILPASKLTSQGEDKRIILRGINLAVATCFASIAFDRAVTITQVQCRQEAAVVSAGTDPTIVLYNNDLATAVGTITIAKAAAQLELDTIAAIANNDIAAGAALNCSVGAAADTSGTCTLMIVYHENP
ncbi:hypothetical protein M0R72_05960 [Candidatus Pacearchaeota archaeon]|jgi:hypothetical protein|nr:hypothetical protein [Candidatus Pacearchaeota archaeon]